MYRCTECNFVGEDEDVTNHVHGDDGDVVAVCPECGAFCDEEEDLSDFAADFDHAAIEAEGLERVPCQSCGQWIDSSELESLDVIQCPYCDSEF